VENYKGKVINLKELKDLKIGFALTASYCNFKEVITYISKLIETGAKVVPIMSYNSYTYDTRFGKAEEFIAEIEEMTGEKIMKTLVDVEPLGPKDLIDIIVVAPCTGNTLAKLANGITDTSVLGAIKTMRRNDKPVVIAIATNDALALNMRNIFTLQNTKGITFVPFKQDNAKDKPYSLVAEWDKMVETIEDVAKGLE